MIHCSKCGKVVDTLAKRRHFCAKGEAHFDDSTTQIDLFEFGMMCNYCGDLRLSCCK